MFAFIVVLFIPNLLDAADSVWEKMDDASSADPWGSSDLNLNFTDWVRQNLVMTSVVIIALTGIVTYAKFKINSGVNY